MMISEGILDYLHNFNNIAFSRYILV